MIEITCDTCLYVDAEHYDQNVCCYYVKCEYLNNGCEYGCDGKCNRYEREMGECYQCRYTCKGEKKCNLFMEAET